MNKHIGSSFDDFEVAELACQVLLKKKEDLQDPGKAADYLQAALDDYVRDDDTPELNK